MTTKWYPSTTPSPEDYTMRDECIKATIDYLYTSLQGRMKYDSYILTVDQNVVHVGTRDECQKLLDGVQGYKVAHLDTIIATLMNSY